MIKAHFRLNRGEKVPHLVEGQVYTFEKSSPGPISIPEWVTEAYIEKPDGKEIALIKIIRIEEENIPNTNVQVRTIESQVRRVYHNGH